ncbi:MAG: hypothetical protein AB7P01_14640 [Bacteroidia bacterium]
MKTTTFSAFAQTRVEALETEIEQEHQVIHEEALKKSRFFAQENRPAPKEAINSYVRPIIEGYSLLTNKVKMGLSKLILEIENELSICKTSIAQLSGQKATLVKEINLKRSALEKYVTTYPWRVLPLVLLFAAIMLVSEVLFNALAFQVFGNSLLFSILIALGITLAVVVVFHLFQKSLTLAKTLLHRILIVIFWVCIITLFFYFLGVFRNSFFESNENNNEVPLLGFIIINWILLIATGYILGKCPQWADVMNKYEELKGKRKIRKLTKSLSALDAELNKRETTQKALERDRDHIPSLQEELSNWISSMTRKTLSDFVMENVANRTDGHSNFNTFDKEDFLNITNPKLQLS